MCFSNRLKVGTLSIKPSPSFHHWLVDFFNCRDGADDGQPIVFGDDIRLFHTFTGKYLRLGDSGNYSGFVLSTLSCLTMLIPVVHIIPFAEGDLVELVEQAGPSSTFWMHPKHSIRSASWARLLLPHPINSQIFHALNLLQGGERAGL